MASAAPVCSICSKPVSLEDCKVDERGNAVHGTCYAAKLNSASEAALPVASNRTRTCDGAQFHTHS